MFQMLGVFSEFEAAMIRERVRTGVARAKRNGTKSGKPIGRPRLSQDQEVAAQKLLSGGMGILKVARTLKIGTGTVSRISAQIRNDSGQVR
jgi:DNA invertase Pin-like site-specific DNA recombinase